MRPPPCYLTHSSFAEARLLPAWATCRAFTVGKTSLHENASLAKRGIARTDDNHSQRRMENALTVLRRAHTQILPFKCGLHRWGDDRPLSQDSPFAIAALLLPPPFHAPVPTRFPDVRALHPLPRVRLPCSLAVWHTSARSPNTSISWPRTHRRRLYCYLASPRTHTVHSSPSPLDDYLLTSP